jgi:PRTRC genetic system protein C
MQIQQTERVFRYSGGLVLPDPDPSLGIEAVRQVYCTKSQNQNSLASS